jgi:leader peptidase (prepilin peptidase)/N-methyltransferase
VDGGALRFAIGAWVVALGATVGSFLNVVIARVPAGESVVRPRSRCPGCRSPIAWYDNVPVVSWLVLRGRCRRCGASIPFRYLAVELAGGAAAWLAWARHGLSLPALAELAFVGGLLALACIDLATWLLPHVLTWPLALAGLAAGAVGAAPAASFRGSALGAAVGFAAFALVALVGRLVTRKEALGFGDVWLLAGIGAWLGVSALLPVVLLASVQGSVYGLALIALGRSEPGPAAPAGAEGAEAAGRPSDAAAHPESSGAVAPDGADAAGGADVRGHAPSPDPDADWVPPRHAVPFGPFLVAGALEWLYLADWLASRLPGLGAFR